MIPENDLEFGEWLRCEIAEGVITDDEGWAFDLVTRAAARIQRGDPPADRLVPIVTWHEDATAFTAPGRYVWLSRELLQRAMSEDAVAFAFAHELAHHRLGHLARLRHALPWVQRAPGASALAVLVQLGDRLLFSPENELAADGWALERCLAVGYDGARCLEVFRALERFALDHRDLAGVFGLDVRPPDDAFPSSIELSLGLDLPEVRTAVRRARRWLDRRRRSHPSLHERRDALAARLRAA